MLMLSASWPRWVSSSSQSPSCSALPDCLLNLPRPAVYRHQVSVTCLLDCLVPQFIICLTPACCLCPCLSCFITCLLCLLIFDLVSCLSLTAESLCLLLFTRSMTGFCIYWVCCRYDTHKQWFGDVNMFKLVQAIMVETRRIPAAFSIYKTAAHSLNLNVFHDPWCINHRMS